MSGTQKQNSSSIRDSFRKRIGALRNLFPKEQKQETDLCLIWQDLNNIFKEVKLGNQDALQGYRHLLNTYKNVDRIFPTNVWKRFFNILDYIHHQPKVFSVDAVVSCLKLAKSFKSFTKNQQGIIKIWLEVLLHERSKNEINMVLAVNNIGSEIRLCNYADNLISILEQYSSIERCHINSDALCKLYNAVAYVASHIYQYSTADINKCLEKAKQLKGFTHTQQTNIYDWLKYGNHQLAIKAEKLVIKRLFKAVSHSRELHLLVTSSILVDGPAQSKIQQKYTLKSKAILFEALVKIMDHQDIYAHEDMTACIKVCIDATYLTDNQKKVLVEKYRIGSKLNDGDDDDDETYY